MITRYVLAPFIPTPVEVVDRMLELAGVTSEDLIYDLGSGDGRIVVRAAERYGARGVGVDVEAYHVERGRERASAAGVDALVRFEEADALSVDLTEATVVTMYLVPWSTRMVAEALVERVRAGTRVVSHNFAPEPAAQAHMTAMTDREGKEHRLYVWVVGEGALL